MYYNSEVCCLTVHMLLFTQFLSLFLFAILFLIPFLFFSYSFSLIIRNPFGCLSFFWMRKMAMASVISSQQTSHFWRRLCGQSKSSSPINSKTSIRHSDFSQQTAASSQITKLASFHAKFVSQCFFLIDLVLFILTFFVFMNITFILLFNEFLSSLIFSLFFFTFLYFTFYISLRRLQKQKRKLAISAVN